MSKFLSIGCCPEPTNKWVRHDDSGEAKNLFDVAAGLLGMASSEPPEKIEEKYDNILRWLLP